jgi:serine/threonine-protein kinase RsbW
VTAANIVPEASVSDVIELSIPVESDLLVLVRLTAAAVASRADFDIEEIEDLRLAVDELCLSVLSGRTRGRLHLTFLGLPEEIEVSCLYEGDQQPVAAHHELGEIDDLSVRILDALVDSHGVRSVEGRGGAWLRKQRARRQD